MTQINRINTDRQSNIELIRIVAMTFIVLWHVVIHASKGLIVGGEYIKAVTVVGVNLFVMISGYFNIRLSSKSFINILSIVLFYNLFGLLAAALIFHRPIEMKDMIDIIFPMSKYGHYWFVSCYLMLMLISPAINTFLNNSNIVTYVCILSAIAYISFVSGWVFNNPINMHGYTVFNMIFMYVLGDCIRRFHFAGKIPKYAWLLLYLLFTFIVYGMIFYGIERAVRYNNPLLVVSTISLFAFFVNLKIQSPIVNRIAICMFPVYLLQDGFVGIYVYKYLYKKGVELNFGLEYWYIISCYVILLFVLALIIEPIRKKIMNAPISWVDKIVSLKLQALKSNILH